MGESVKPVVLLAFANDRVDDARYLRNLPKELRNLCEALEPAADAGHCEIITLPNATVDEICDALQKHRDQVAIFHYGGHAGGSEIILETPLGAASVAHAGGLAALLGAQRGLQLVFLNGCSSQRQVAGLLDAGVPAVIATSRAIDDAVATEFSTRFYKGLACGGSVPTAYHEAHAEARTRFGDVPNSAYRDVVSEPVAGDTWPWDLSVAEGAAEYIESWSLALATHDPYFGLPALPVNDLPEEPFKHLEWFTRADAEIFFGRGKEIRRLYKAATLPDSAPIVLLYGATGVGKSSLLDAGVHPRLEAGYEFVYLRRDGGKGLLGSLDVVLDTSDCDLGTAWRRHEEKSGRPLLIVLDQVEEAFTRPNPALPREMAELAAGLRPVFTARERRPQGRIFLSFRKEWLAEIQDLLNGNQLPYRRILIKHLDRDGIVEAVEGPARNSRLREHFGLQVEPELAGIIADDLLEDRDAAIAPALQILLTKMWNQARDKNRDAPVFTVDLYQDLKREGILLDDFLDEQLRVLREWQPELVDSGLALDLLAYHTTPIGTAQTRGAGNVIKRYPGRPEIVGLIQQCKDRYLLGGTARVAEEALLAQIDDTGNLGNTRLAHDTLAPLVRQRFQASDLPGQRALRILLQRAVDWADGAEGAPLDEPDLAVVEAGEPGMRARNHDEERLITASRQRRDQHRRQARTRRRLSVAAVALITVSMIFGWSMWRVSERQAASLEVALEQTYLQEARRLVDADRPRDALARLAGALRLGSWRARVRAVDLLVQLRSPMPTGSLQHRGAVLSAAFSPVGQLLATTSEDGTARLWNARSGSLRHELSHDGHTSVNSAAFSVDGNHLATSGADGTVRVWGTEDGELRATIPVQTGGAVSSAAFSPDGQVVVAAHVDGTARFWRWAHPELLLTVRHAEGAAINSAAFSDDGRHVVTAAVDGTAKVWDVAAGAEVATLRHDSGRNIKSAAFSPGDGSYIVTASLDATVSVWDRATGATIGRPLVHPGAVSSVAFSPDGERVVTGSGDGVARVWSWRRGEIIGTPITHAGRGSVNAVAFAPDGLRVATASDDGTARLWDVGAANATAAAVQTLPQNDYVLSAAFHPDGHHVVTALDDQTARIWDLDTGAEVGPRPLLHDMGVTSAAFSPDGLWIVTGSDDGAARVWDVADRQERAKLQHPSKAIVRSAVFSPDGKWVVTASEDGTARIWDWQAGERLRTLQHDSRYSINSAVFSGDGRWLVTSCEDGTAQIWDAATGDPVAGPFRHDGADELLFAAFSPDRRLLVTASSDWTARLWDLGDVNDVRAVGSPMQHTGSVVSVAFSPDGERLITASGDGTARLWDASTGAPLRQPLQHDDWVRSAAFSPDGNRVVTASDDRTAKVWDIDVSLETETDSGLLADLVEVVAGYRFNAAGNFEVLPADVLHAHLENLGFRLTPGGDFAEVSEAERPSGVGSYVAALARWCLIDSRRTVSPLSRLDTADDHLPLAEHR